MLCNSCNFFVCCYLFIKIIVEYSCAAEPHILTVHGVTFHLNIGQFTDNFSSSALCSWRLDHCGFVPLNKLVLDFIFTLQTGNEFLVALPSLVFIVYTHFYGMQIILKYISGAMTVPFNVRDIEKTLWKSL